MLTLPILNDIKTKQEMVKAFGGYSHNLVIGQKEFFDMKNMSSDLSPVLSPRKPRGILRSIGKPNGIHSHEELMWVDGTELYYAGKKVANVSDSQKQFVNMGAYVCIFPDKTMYNTHTGEYTQLECKTSTSATVTVTLCRDDGSEYGDLPTGSTAPESPQDADLWIDTSADPVVLKQYSTVNGGWISMPTTYVRIFSKGIGRGFSEYDGVTISGLANDSLNGEFIIQSASEDFIVIIGIVDETMVQDETVTVSRTVPDFDFVCESENRLWACSSEKSEIYASKLGDPKNWRVYMGISTDSYTATIGSSGDFTGCCRHNGYVYFFKEHIIHRVYGTKPANFKLTEINALGVEAGSDKSMQVINEILYYKSREGIFAITSSVPENISYAFGAEKYRNARGGMYGQKYYVCMDDGNGVSHVFVYDTQRGMWHKEDDANAIGFAEVGRDLYFIADGFLYSVGGTLDKYGEEPRLEKNVPWMVETGDIGLDDPDHKYISKLQLRMEVGEGATLCIETKEGGFGDWRERARRGFTRKTAMTVPIIPMRCDTMKIRISGRGDCKIYSLAKVTESGSEY